MNINTQNPAGGPAGKGKFVSQEDFLRMTEKLHDPKTFNASFGDEHHVDIMQETRVAGMGADSGMLYITQIFDADSEMYGITLDRVMVYARPVGDPNDDNAVRVRHELCRNLPSLIDTEKNKSPNLGMDPVVFLMLSNVLMFETRRQEQVRKMAARKALRSLVGLMKESGQDMPPELAELAKLTDEELESAELIETGPNSGALMIKRKDGVGGSDKNADDGNIPLSPDTLRDAEEFLRRFNPTGKGN